MGRSVEFLLVPDASAGRRVRRALASRRAWTGVIVGTWVRLLKEALRTYALPQPAADPNSFRDALGTFRHAFWSKSLTAAPEETAAVVAAALKDVSLASDPGVGLAGVAGRPAEGRLKQRLHDLERLARSNPAAVPWDLQAVQLLLKSSDAPTVPLRVRTCPGVPSLSRWQQAVVDRLNAHSDGASHPYGKDLDGVLRSCLDLVPSAPPGSALRTMQEGLFERNPPAADMDATVQWVGLRDHCQEAEIAAGMVQSMLAQEPSLNESDIGLLVPDSFEYSVAVADCFSLAGLRLSGLHGERWKRDLGREAVYHFLHCRQKPAPAMALAACFSSRVMPWPTEVGGELARQVMDGDFSPKLPRDAGAVAHRMRSLLLGADETPESLGSALASFARLLNGGERFAAHAKRAAEAVELLRDALRVASSVDWSELRKLVQPAMITNGSGPEFSVEGIAVWRERQEAWRQVKHLIVLGFCEGRYPARVPFSAVFSPPELRELRNRLGLPVDGHADKQARARLLFRRQLRGVSGSVTFLVPHLSPGGEVVRESESFVFMQQLVTSADPGGLVAMLDSTADRPRIRHLAIAEPSAPTGPRGLRPRAPLLRLGRDLLALKSDRKGGLRAQSPTSLERLMVSPLGWLLHGLKAEPIEWRPESASPLVTGALAHGVFERLFKPGRALPSRRAVASSAKAELATVARQQAPFLAGPHWFVERRSLSTGAARAAEAWRSVLEDLQAEVLGIEEWLEGTWAGVRLHGKADLILGLADSNVLIVDYKWSMSRKRWERMEKGYESQIALYREMLRSGGLRALGGKRTAGRSRLPERLRAAQSIGIAYFTMLDQACLSDFVPASLRPVPSWRAVDRDPSEKALGWIEDRLRSVRRGEIELNLATDKEQFESKLGLATFALQISPLIELFAIEPGPAPERAQSSVGRGAADSPTRVGRLGDHSRFPKEGETYGGLKSARPVSARDRGLPGRAIETETDSGFEGM